MILRSVCQSVRATFRLIMMDHRTTFGYARLSGSKNNTRMNIHWNLEPSLWTRLWTKQFNLYRLWIMMYHRNENKSSVAGESGMKMVFNAQSMAMTAISRWLQKNQQFRRHFLVSVHWERLQQENPKCGTQCGVTVDFIYARQFRRHSRNGRIMIMRPHGDLHLDGSKSAFPHDTKAKK